MNKNVKHRSSKKPGRISGKPPVMRVPYNADGTKCKVCNEGVLRPTQWNRLNCSSNKCNHSELA